MGSYCDQVGMIYCCLTLQCMGHSDNLIKKITRPLDCISCLRPKSGPNMTPGWNKTHYCIESCLQVIGGQRCCYRRDSVVGHNLSPFLLFGHGKREGVSLWFYDCDIDKLMHRFYDIDKLMNRCCDIELLAILPLVRTFCTNHNSLYSCRKFWQEILL